MLLVSLTIYWLAVSCTTTSPIINGQAYNITSFSGFYQYVNNACGGAVGWGLAIMIFVIIFIVTSMYASVGPGLISGGGVMAIVAVLLQQIGIVGSGMPLLFGGIFVLGIIVTILQGVLDPFR